VRELALAIRHRGRDAVHVNPHTSHAEGRTGAESADRQLQVLRVVLAIARDHAGNEPHALGQVDFRPARSSQPRAIEHIDRRGNIEGRSLAAGGGDGDLWQGLGNRAARRGKHHQQG
jgi:hypothetical protein